MFIRIKTGSLRIKQAERGLNRLDPLPDLDNANVGIYTGTRNFGGYVSLAYPPFWV